MAISVGMLAAFVSAVLHPAAAHDGPHMARVLTDVVAVQAQGRDVLIDLRIEALQEPVVLAAASAGFATSPAAPPDMRIVPGEPMRHTVHLRFDGDVPPLFTLSLDFGEAGFGTVLIVVK